MSCPKLVLFLASVLSSANGSRQTDGGSFSGQSLLQRERSSSLELGKMMEGMEEQTCSELLEDADWGWGWNWGGSGETPSAPAVQMVGGSGGQHMQYGCSNLMAFRAATDVGAGAKLWHGGVVAGNGRIYGVPYNANNVLEIDPVGNTAEAFGSLEHHGAAKYKAAVVAANGHIYCIPHHAAQVLEVDPQTREFFVFGDLGAATFKYSGGVLASNGRIYGVPYNADEVLEIDPEARTAVTFGNLPKTSKSVGESAQRAGVEKFEEGIVANNGKIYCIPGSSKAVLEIDPQTRSTSLFGDLGQGMTKYMSGVLGSDGRIYGIPYKAVEVLVIDPDTRTASTFGNVGSGCSKFYGGVVAPNGKIYGMPYNSPSVLEIDPEKRTVSTFGSVGDDFSKFTGGSMGANGRIYALPYSANGVLEVNVDTRQAGLLNDLRASLPPQQEVKNTFPKATSAIYKYLGTVRSPDGSLYGVPHSVSSILKVGACK